MGGRNFTPSRPPASAALGHKRDGSRDMLSQGVAGSGLDQGSTPTPPNKKLCFIDETRILASRLSVSGILGLYIEVDPVVHEPCIPVTVWRVWRNAVPSSPLI